MRNLPAFDSRPSRRVDSTAFTLIELLCVIAVIAVLSAIMIPAIGRAGFRSKVAKCTNNFRQLGIACASYSAEGKGMLPSFKLPATSSMSNYHTITPSMVAFDTLASMEKHGVTDPAMWFCPVRVGRWNVANTTFKSARGRNIGSISDLTDYYRLVAPIPSVDVLWWIPRELEGFNGQRFPDPRLSTCRTSEGWPSKADDAHASTQPIASDILVARVDESTSGIGELSGGGHPHGGKIVKSNSLFADGHVETKPFAAIKWQMKAREFGLAYFY